LRIKVDPVVNNRVGFLPWQKVFLPGQWKKTVKTAAKTGNKFSTLNWIEILGCIIKSLMLGTSLLHMTNE